MRLSRRSFLRAAVVSPLIVGAWEVWEQGVRPGGRVRPVVCCLPNVWGRSCVHPAPLKADEQPKGNT
jgi:hypothetical protein